MSTPLVAYSDSSADDEPPPLPKQLKRKRSAQSGSDLPALPQAFHDLYSTNARISTIDDPNLHGGRRRQVPHVEGNWPSHVYLEWRPSHSETVVLADLIAAAAGAEEPLRPEEQVHSLLHNDLDVPLPLHISLSRTLALQTDGRHDFLDKLSRAIRRTAVKPFTVSLSNLAWYPNHDRSRWFLSLSTARPETDELNGLLRACNATAIACGQPILYAKQEDDNADPLPDYSAFFHLSIAWSLALPTYAGSVERLWQRAAQSNVNGMRIDFDTVKVKIGNTIHSVDLLKNRTEDTGRVLW
ncbi:hypothetical protein EJ06DRAFT_553978 [Trichodelitschia bisporula]|uniref:U6 snRNA phosphodiesterase n=1 Tax=Trichodelitschia bisporula TaxID=703511 RepID=A0A6G1I6R5_9PEZI|nr:hypothetical protein EJ06DRAFT_553978 [Trichodelitschia bisporula]